MRTKAMLLMLVLSGSAAASAADALSEETRIPKGGLTAQELCDWLKWRGYRATVEQGKTGMPYVESYSDGMVFSVDLYDCVDAGKEKRCGSLQAYAYFTKPEEGFPKDLGERWAKERRWTSSYFDADGDALVQQDINLPKDSTYGALGENFDIWYKMLRLFREHAFGKPKDD